MAWLDDRLSRDLKRLSEPVETGGLAERLARRKARRRVTRRLQAAGLGAMVLAASVGGGFGLLRAFQGGPDRPRPGATPTPQVGPTPSASPSATPSPEPPSGGPEGLIAFSTTRTFPRPPRPPRPPDSESGSAVELDEWRMRFDEWQKRLEEYQKWEESGDPPPGASPEGLYVMNSDGTNPYHFDLDAALYSLPTWSPDGERLAVFRVGAEGGSLGQGIYTLRPDGTGLHRLFINELPIPAGVTDLEWSPDGTHIAFVQVDWYNPAPAAESAGELWVMGADGSHARPVTPPDTFVYDFSWSPNGSQLVYTRQSLPSGNRFVYDLFVMNADGSDARQLTDDGRPREVAWSPDGTKMAFIAHAEGSNFTQGNVYVMGADGTDPVQLTDMPGAYAPEWSPDSSRIVFVHDCSIYTVDVATGAIQTVADKTSLTWLCLGDPAWQP